MNLYRAPRWLPGGHAQSIYPLLIKPQPFAYRRERWETPDGDFIDLDWSRAARPDAPLVALFHGLEGSSNSHYALSLMAALKAIGWSGVVVHFRGCSGETNRLPRAYHSGDSTEADWVLRRLKAGQPDRPLYAMGVSLGGNVLLKWLGERGHAACAIVDAAVAVSAPLDLVVCGHGLGHGFNRVYTQYFLRTLKPGAAARLKRFPGLFDGERLARVRTVYDFDELVTGPLHGFAGADDYWRRSSSKPWLREIRAPTLVLNARNDPFLPANALPRASEVSAEVKLEFPAQGGHVGFVSGSFPGTLNWLPQRVLHFLHSGE